MKTNDERIHEILGRLDKLSYIKPESIPNIELYMDQVTTFMDENLKEMKRYPDDKVLTKTMINNYAKNNLLPAPNKKKYSKEHILLLIFIYYFKNLLSISDIEELLRPLTDKHFANPETLPLEAVYQEVFSLEAEEIDSLKDDIIRKYERSGETFASEGTDEDDREYLRLFALVCELSFDVYMKKQIIERIIDDMRETSPSKKKK